MARADMTLEELEGYLPDVAEPADFDSFWADTLAEARGFDLNVEATQVETPFNVFDVFDVSFSGFGGDRIGAWLTLPRGAEQPLPGVVEFIGYNGGRGLPGFAQPWAAAGYAHLLVDTRGQGAGWGTGGTTGDPHGSGPQQGFMTKGIEDPATYYYRRVFTDAVRAVEAARELPQVDASRVSVTGGSQGGAITLAVSGLVPDLTAVMPDVPFLCHFRRAVDICDRDPFAELCRYLSIKRNLVDQVFETLSYFDGVNFAKRANAPTLFSVGLMDKICPPSTVYAAYNHYAGEKEIEVYQFNDHEGGENQQKLAQVEWLGRRLAP